jgi:putative peptidoglycan lipid II flippase
LELKMPGLRRIGWLMVPRLISLGLVELADIFFVRLGSRLPDGHLSAYFWGWRLMQLPETLFGTAVAQVFFPTFAELANARDWDGLRQRANAALRIILTLTVPSAVALILLGRSVVSLIGGAFDAEAVDLVHAALVIMSVRLVGEALLEIGARLFYAQQDTTTPMIAAALGQSTSIGLGYALIEPLGFRGLAIATTIGFWLESSLLLVIAQRRIGGLVNRELLGALARALAGTGVLGLAVQGAQVVLPTDGGRIQLALVTGLTVLVGLAGYLVSLIALRSPELHALPSLFIGTLRRRGSSA